MFSIFKKKKDTPEEIASAINSEKKKFISENTKALATQKGFAVYRGEDLLKMDQIKPLVEQLKNAFGGDVDTFNKHIYPSMRVLAAYCQFLPASENRHHCEYLGLLTHSLQAAIVAMNYLRNCNVNFGVSPDHRNEHTLAYKIACTLAALLHDVGKINDWNIVTRVHKSSGMTVECSYNFIRSIPEFLAKSHNIDLKDVYGSPFNEELNLYVPKYEILNARPGRSNKHEIIGNNKQGLFVSSNTEELIADASYELYEDFHFYMYANLIDKMSITSLMQQVVQVADTESARFWAETHKGLNTNRKTSEFSSFSVNTPAPVINITVDKSPTVNDVKAQTNTQGISNVSNNTSYADQDVPETTSAVSAAVSEPETVSQASVFDTAEDQTVYGEEEIPSAAGQDEVAEADEVQEEQEGEQLTSTSTDFYDMFGSTQIGSSLFKDELTQNTSTEAEQHPEPTPAPAPVNKAAIPVIHEEGPQYSNLKELSESPDFLSDLNQNEIDDDHKKAVRIAFIKSLTQFLTDPTSTMCLINQDKPDAYLFTQGVQLKGNSKRKIFCFMRFDEASRGFWHELFSKTIQSSGIEIFKTLICSNQEYLYKALLILKLYDLVSISDTHQAIYRICPEAFWTEKHATLHYFDAVLLSHYKVAFPDDSTLSDCLSNFQNSRILFEDVDTFPFLKDLSVFSATGIKTAAITREYQITGKVSTNVAKTEGQTTEVTASLSDDILLNSDPDDLAYSGMLSPAFDKHIKDKAQAQTFASKNFIDANRHTSTINDNASIIKKVEEEEDLRYEVNKRILNNCNYFKADRDEEKQIERLKNQQHFFYFSEDEIKKLRDLSESDKAIELENTKTQIVDKLKNKGFEKDLFKEIRKALIMRSSYINFKEIADGNYYASFVWNVRNQKKTGGFGAKFFNEILFNGLVPLCLNGDRSKIKDELEFFGCTILDPLITKFMILSGIDKSFRVEIKNWTNPNKTAKDMLRYFEHLVIQCPSSQSVYGFPVTGNAITGLHISYEALKACVVELDCPAYESQRSKLLNLKNQANPPFCWKTKDMLTISFFKKEDLEQNIFSLQKKKE